jgi:two-component system, LytTR family, sensor kinase
MTLNFKRHNYYLLFAAAFLLFWFFFKLGGMPDFKRAILSASADVILSFGALLIAGEVLLPKFLYKGMNAQFVTALLFVIAASGTLIIIAQLALDGMSISDYDKKMLKYNEHFFYWFWSDLVVGSYFLTGFVVIGGTAIRLAFDRVENSKHVALLEKEKLQLEVDNLKNQINPHFLFNALNTIYYKIDKTNAPARELTEQFSSLLRYQLYECNEPRVLVEKELKLIRNYIELQKERLSQDTKVTFCEKGDAKNIMIPPYLLLPLIENCFKHVSHFTDQENSIDIITEVKNNSFSLCTTNTFAADVKSDQKGIGLTNIKKRLELVCQGKYTFKTIKEGHKFGVELILDIV